MAELRQNCFLNVQLTKDSFSSEEIKKIKKELEASNASKFITKAIKTYLETKDNSSADELEELRFLMERNYSLLKELKSQDASYNSSSKESNGEEFTSDATNDKVYNKNKQEVKREQALNLLNQF